MPGRGKSSCVKLRDRRRATRKAKEPIQQWIGSPAYSFGRPAQPDREAPTVRATIASVAESGPYSRAVVTPSNSLSFERARLTRLLMVPTAQPDTDAASS